MENNNTILATLNVIIDKGSNLKDMLGVDMAEATEVLLSYQGRDLVDVVKDTLLREDLDSNTKLFLIFNYGANTGASDALARVRHEMELLQKNKVEVEH